MNLLNIDANAKTVKGQKKGYLTGVLYLAPFTISGKNVCPMAELAGCWKDCLNVQGRGGISAGSIKFDAVDGQVLPDNSIQRCRIRRTNMYHNELPALLAKLEKEINALVRKADRLGFIPCVRLNGTSDIRWENVKFADGTTIFDRFPTMIFYDYTFDNNNPITLTIDGTIDPNNANTEVSFPISTQDDTIDELDEETLSVIGTITSGDVGDQDLAKIGTIVDNDDPPSIEMNDSSAIEGDDLVHTITLSHPSSTPILINLNVSDGTATSPDDYTFNPNPASLEIEATTDPANPNLQVSFPIPTRTDNINELDEELNVIGTVTSGNVGTQDLTKTGTIIDNNLDPMVVIDDVTVVEGNTLVFTITLLDENLELVQNSFPINLDLESVDGTATAGQDFESVLTNTSIPPFTSSITQSVQTIDDRLNEETETMQLQVTIRSTEVTNSSSMIFGTGTIKDNDVPNLFSPNGDGKSDVFRIAGIEDFPNFKLIIIDRWGSEVYNYSNNGNINPIWWDGTHKGKPVIEGVYFYTLDFNDGSTPPQTNFIQLIR
mgnify:CR=1 FL=1